MSALRRFLVDFDAPAPRRPSTVALRPLFGAEAPPEHGPGPAAPPGPEVDRAAEAAAAARAVALSEAEAAHAAALAALAARHEADLAEARARWAAGEGAALAEGFRSAVADLGHSLGEAAGSALEPLLGDALRALAVEGLRAAVADLVLAGLGGAVAVSGPADLVAALRAALDAAGIGTESMSFTASDTSEVVATADNSRIETRLAAWAGALGRRLSVAERPAGTTGEDAR